MRQKHFTTNALIYNMTSMHGALKAADALIISFDLTNTCKSTE